MRRRALLKIKSQANAVLVNGRITYVVTLTAMWPRA